MNSNFQSQLWNTKDFGTTKPVKVRCEYPFTMMLPKTISFSVMNGRISPRAMITALERFVPCGGCYSGTHTAMYTIVHPRRRAYTRLSGNVHRYSREVRRPCTSLAQEQGHNATRIRRVPWVGTPLCLAK